MIMEEIGMIQNKIVVGILPTYNLKDMNDPYQDRASFVTMYSNKIKECGGIPIGILEKDVSLYTNLCDAYLIPGGTKIWRDFFPIFLDALKNHKPILGVCMGAQMISMFFNLLEDQKQYPELSLEEIYQKLKEENPYLVKLPEENIHNHVVTKEIESIEKAKHEIQIVKNSLLYQIYKQDRMDVVSLHSIVIHRVPKNLLVSAKTIDDVIEAVEYQDFILGVQFHPEIVEDNKIFEWLIEEGRKCQKSRKLKQ